MKYQLIVTELYLIHCICLWREAHFLTDFVVLQVYCHKRSLKVTGTCRKSDTEVRQFTRSVVIQTMQCRHFCTEALFMLWCPVWSVCCRECEIEKTRKKKRFRLKLILLIYLLINRFISELFAVLCWQKYTFLLP